MKKKNQPQFFVMYKNFTTGKLETYDVLPVLFNSIFTSKGTINKKEFHIYDKQWNEIPVRTKEQLQEFIETDFRCRFWAKCEWEFIVIDWPHRDTINDSRPVKIDAWNQLEPNLPVITELVWNYIEPKINKLIEKEK
jgi:hypothetical protein